MSLSFLRLIGRRPRSIRRPVRPPPWLSPRTEAVDDGPSGCGWFDSSHALHAGLQVQEHAGTESLGQVLPLPAWLDLQLAGWRPVPTL